MSNIVKNMTAPARIDEDPIWARASALYEHLKQENLKKNQLNAEIAKEIAADITTLESQLGNLVDWDSMPTAMMEVRHVAGKGNFIIPDIVGGFLAIGGWIWFASLTDSWLWGLVLAMICLYGASRMIRELRSAGLESAISIKVIRFVEQQPEMEFPWRFEYLSVNANGTSTIQSMNIEGLTEVPPNGYFLGIFSRDDRSLGYLRMDQVKTAAIVWRRGEYQIPRKAIKADLDKLLETEAGIFQRLRTLIKAVDSNLIADLDIGHMKERWNSIVLPDDSKEQLLRAAILFALGDKSAPKGILLKGPPGTGKTLLSDVIATSIGIPMIKLSIADIKGKVIGESGANVRRIWETARQDAPVIIFVDECDGAFVARGGDQGDVYANEIVQTFLTEWDGIGGDHRILVIGATNRPELIDLAVMSRFSDVIELTPPKANARMELIASVARQLKFETEVPESAHRLMDGLSGREVRNILQQAQRLAMPATPSLSHFEEAAAKVRGKAATSTDASASWETLILPLATKQRLKTMCQMVKESEDLATRGIPVPKALLLYGPPGTGKTQIARTFANESGLGFLARSTADLKGQYLGHAAGRIAQAFETARNMSPAILFIDEIDALTSSRDGETQDQLQMEALTQLLQELDGITARPGHVFVVAATNRLDAMDAAILSRFSQKLEIGLPSQSERQLILQTLLEGRPVADNLNVEELSKNTEGYSGRDLRELIATGFNRAVERTLAAGQSARNSNLQMEDINFQAQPGAA